MGHNNGKITAPVNTDDVSAVIGVSSHDVATLCTSDRIKPAAIFRPRYSSNNPGLNLVGSDGKFSAAAQTEIAGNIGQRPGALYGCPGLGIWVQQFPLNNITPSAYGNMHSYARNTWFVPTPDNGTESFKIFDHFVNYDHNAKFQDPVLIASVTKKNTTTNTIQIQFSTPSPLNQPGTISVGNMFGGKGWYFGAVVFRGTNSGGITQNDIMIILGSGVAIKSDAATTVTVTKDDTPPNASSATYYYRIVPFVCNKANVTSALDTDFYSIHMSDDFIGMYELKVGDSASGGGIKTYAFLWSEPSNMGSATITGTNYINYCYPSIDGKKVPITPYTYHPGIVATFKGRPVGFGNAPLKDLYSRIDFHFSFYSGGKHNILTYTWRKSGALTGDKVLTRETSKDNIGGFEDYLFFSVANANDILNAVSDPSEIELTADFYYTNGLDKDEGLWATWIPDND